MNAERPDTTLDALRWGLVPYWAKDIKIGYSLINAKAETVAEKPAFRDAFKSRRCLIAADGFYEWAKLDTKTKQPYAITMKDLESGQVIPDESFDRVIVSAASLPKLPRNAARHRNSRISSAPSSA